MALDEIEIDVFEPGDLLADRAFKHLSEAILRNQIRPGTPLSVPALARKMQISRSPVREAVQRLIYEGLAEHHPHRGAVVTEVRPDDFCHLLEVRELLEGLAARLAASRLTADDVDRLGTVLDGHERVVESGDEVANVAFDVAFHQHIRDASGNPHLQITLSRIQSRAHLSLYSLWQHDRNPRLALDEHRAIYRALAAGDPEESDDAARRHIRRLRERVPDTGEGGDRP